eukprot:1764601-Rhodomonas_salina.3
MYKIEIIDNNGNHKALTSAQVLPFVLAMPPFTDAVLPFAEAMLSFLMAVLPFMALLLPSMHPCLHFCWQC